MTNRKCTATAIFFVTGFLVVMNSPLALADEPQVLDETVIDGYFLGMGNLLAVNEEDEVFVAADFQGDRNDILLAKIGSAGEVAWQTVIRGYEIDVATAMVIDESGNLLVAGWTDSEDFPTTVDALYPLQVAHRDGFLLRVASADGALLYGTYLGGNHSEQVEAMALADDGTIYLAGSTDSPDFPVVDPLQGSLNNPPYQFSDGFVTRLSSDARVILYSSYLGGNRDDSIMGIGLQPNGEIVVAGVTDSTDLTVAGGMQTTFAGGYRDAFVSVLSDDGSELITSTYLGGAGWDQVYGFGVGPGGSPYIAGWTDSADFPTSDSAFQPSFVGAIGGCEVPFGADRNCFDGWVARLTTNLDSLVYGTYLGGELDDEIRGLAVDSHGRASLAGYTLSSDFPATSGIGGAAMFAARLGPAGRHLDFAVAIDAMGSPNAGHGVAVDRHGRATYVTGARNVPADIYVARVGVEGMLFADAFESTTVEAWHAAP